MALTTEQKLEKARRTIRDLRNENKGLNEICESRVERLTDAAKEKGELETKVAYQEETIAGLTKDNSLLAGGVKRGKEENERLGRFNKDLSEAKTALIEENTLLKKTIEQLEKVFNVIAELVLN